MILELDVDFDVSRINSRMSSFLFRDTRVFLYTVS